MVPDIPSIIVTPSNLLRGTDLNVVRPKGGTVQHL